MTPEPRRQLGALTTFLVIAATVFVAALALGPAPVPRKALGASPIAKSSLADGEAPPVEVADAASASVAFITTFNGTGSGVLVGEGLVVTNAHVVWPFEVVGVLFPGGEQRTARVIGTDPRSDLALLEVPDGGLPPPLEIGRPDALRRSERLYLIGYPGVVDLSPDPAVVETSFLGDLDWVFSGVEWLAADSPAIGGQSGGALVDLAGRLVGVTTFGSAAEVYAVAAPDVVAIAETLTLRTGAWDRRRPPRRGGAPEQPVVIEGPWAQATFVTWVTPGTRSQIGGAADVSWRALDPFGVELAAGRGDIEITWPLGTPGILHATSRGRVDATAASDVPIIPAPDPDDGRVIGAGTVSGLVDVPGDRDWYYVEHAEQASIAIAVEAQTRMRVALYDRATSALVGQVVNERGFFFDDPPLVVENLAAGTYVVVVEDIAAQFGTYEIVIE